MTEPADLPVSDEEFFLNLQREYVAELPERLAEIEAEIARYDADEPDAATALKARFHRLAGSGGSYGFSEISRIARELELWVAGHPARADRARLAHGMWQLIAALRDAGADVVEAPRPEVPAGQALRALVIVSAATLRAKIIRLLEGVGYQVRTVTRQDPPHLRRPSDQRVDLLVIVGEAGDGDPSAVASAWTTSAESRPRAVVLVEVRRSIDRLRAVAAGIDMVVPIDATDQLLPKYASTLANIGAAPAGVVLLDSGRGETDAVAALLEDAHVRLTRTTDPAVIPALLEREVPDLLLVGPKAQGFDPAAVTAAIRQDRRFTLHPVLFLGPDTTAARIAALQAGGDDFLPLPPNPTLLVQAIVTRAERGRRLRELVHRDTLTGLLNTTTLLAELEHAVAHERLHGGTLAFLIVEIEGVPEPQDSSDLGDALLLHVANVFRANVRASDVIGRWRGPSFGMVLRGGTAQGAVALAAKLSRVLAEHPYRTLAGEIVPLGVRIGTPCFPGDGLLAADLDRAADRALQPHPSSPILP